MAILTCIVRYYLMQWNDAQHHTLFSSVQSLTQSCLTLCDPMNRSMPGLPVHHHLPEFTQLMSIESVMPSSHLILCCPFFLLPPIPPSIRVFSNESTLPQGIVRYHLMQVRMAIIKKSTSNKFWRGCGEKGNFLHCWWQCTLIQPLWRTVWNFSLKTKTKTTIWPKIPLLGTHSEKTITENDTCTPMHTAALFTTARTWEQPDVHWQMNG